MAKQYLTRANLIDGGVSPISSPNVQVPIKNIALAGEADLFGSLAQRLDSFSQVAFKAAGQEAERQGMKFGIDNAPTLEEVEAAKLLGKPVEISGDYSSGQIFQQAAYKGSMAVTETHYSTAARKALMEVVIDNAESTPEIFSQRVSAVVTEYSQALAQLDPASAAKLQSSLGIVANGNILQHSRSFALKQKKELRESARVGSIQKLDGILDVIKGFKVDPTNQLTIDVLIDGQLEEAVNLLEAAEVGPLKIQEFKERFKNKAIADKIKYLAFSVENIDNPTGAREETLIYDVARSLKKGNYKAKEVQQVFDSLPTAADRIKAIAGVMTIADQRKKIRIGDQLAKDAEKDKVKDAWSTNFTKRLFSEDNKFPTRQAALNEINKSPLEGDERLKWYGAVNSVFSDKKTGKLTTEQKEAASENYTKLYEQFLNDGMGVNGLIDWQQNNPDKIPLSGNDGINLKDLHAKALSIQKTELKDIEKAIKRNTDISKDNFIKDTELVKDPFREGGVIFNLFRNDVRRRALEIYNNKKGEGFEKEQAVMDFLDPSKQPFQQIQSMFLARLPKARQNFDKMLAASEKLQKDAPPSIINVDPINSEKELVKLSAYKKANDPTMLNAAKNYLIKNYAYPPNLEATSKNINTFIDERIKGL